MGMTMSDLVELVLPEVAQPYRNAKHVVRVYLRLKAAMESDPGCVDYERLSEMSEGHGAGNPKSGHRLEVVLSEKITLEKAIRGALASSELYERRIWRMVRLEGMEADDVARVVSVSRERAYRAIGTVDGRIETALGIKCEGE